LTLLHDDGIVDEAIPRRRRTMSSHPIAKARACLRGYLAAARKKGMTAQAAREYITSGLEEICLKGGFIRVTDVVIDASLEKARTFIQFWSGDQPYDVEITSDRTLETAPPMR
jgi:hypothetical protein